MNKRSLMFVVAIFSAASTVSCVAAMSQQTQQLEARIAMLENKVKNLENVSARVAAVMHEIASRSSFEVVAYTAGDNGF